MAARSHPRLASSPQRRRRPHPPRSLSSLDPTPVLESFPPLPSKQRSFLDDSFTLTTHLVPAAFPRSTPYVPLPTLPTWSADKQQRKASVLATADEIASMRYKQWNGELHLPPSRKSLWVCVNRYARKDSQGGSDKGITLFFAHANGLHKETWEPTLLELLHEQRKAHGTYAIDEIWAWEAVNHGDAYLVNSSNLGGLYDWLDNSRDIIHFLLHYLPSSSPSSALPTHLPRLSGSVAEERRMHGVSTRTIVGVGHSLGGCTITRAALAEPQLFSSLILVDPIIRPYPTSGPAIEAKSYALMVGAIQRQDRWPSREDARAKFLASPFFGAWHPAVLALYLECALCDDPDGGVRLKMPGIHEALVFSDTMVPYETWDLVDVLDERIELRWIVPGKNPAADAGVREEMVWRRPQNSSNVVIASSGHLIAQEAPVELAHEIHDFLRQKYCTPASRL